MQFLKSRSFHFKKRFCSFSRQTARPLPPQTAVLRLQQRACYLNLILVWSICRELTNNALLHSELRSSLLLSHDCTLCETVSQQSILNQLHSSQRALPTISAFVHFYASNLNFNCSLYDSNHFTRFLGESNIILLFRWRFGNNGLSRSTTIIDIWPAASSAQSGDVNDLGENGQCNSWSADVTKESRATLCLLCCLGKTWRHSPCISLDNKQRDWVHRAPL